MAELPPSPSDRRAVRARSLQQAARRLPRSVFEAQFPGGLWLVRKLERTELVTPVFRTGGADLSDIDTDLGEPRASLRQRLAFDPAGYVLHPLTKSSANPWREQVLIGRALNNDVVLRFNCVSKLHAYVRLLKTDWRIFDAESANGTWVDDRRIRPDHEKGAVIRSGAVVHFGSMRCEIIGNSELYDVLRGLEG